MKLSVQGIAALIVQASILVFSGCASEPTENQTLNQAEALKSHGAEAIGLITLDIPPSNAQLCQERHKTLNKVIEWKAKKILEYCNQNSFGECAIQNECMKSILRTVQPTELTLGVSVTDYNLDTFKNSSFDRNFFVADKGTTSLQEVNAGLTIQFSFKWKFGGPAAVTRKEVCVSPLETEIGKQFVTSLMSALDQAHLYHKNDPCRKLATQDETIPHRTPDNAP